MMELTTQRKVTLKAHFLSATSTIRFPSYFTVLWKSNDPSLLQETARAEVKQGLAVFDQTLTLSLLVSFNVETQEFGKCETQVHLRLISKSKQHQQPKLVGKINLEISSILNNPQIQGATTDYPLAFCSVSAVLRARFEVQEVYKCQTAKSHIIINATPPKSPPTLAFAKSREASIKQQPQDSRAEKVSLSATKVRLLGDKGEKTRENERQSLTAEQENGIKQLQNLRRVNQRLAWERDQLKNSLAENTESLNICQEELISAKSESEKLREEIRKKLDQNVKIQLQMSEVSEQNSQKAFLLAASHRESHKIQIVNAQLQRTELEKQQLKAKLKELEAAVHQMKSHKYNLQKQLNTSKNQANLLKSQLQNQLKLAAAMHESQNKIKAESQKLYTSLSNQKHQQLKIRLRLQEKVVQLQGKIVNFQQRFVAMQTAQTGKEQQIEQIQSLKQQREQRISQIQSIILLQEEEIRTLKESNSSLQLNLAHKQKELVASQVQKKQLVRMTKEQGLQVLQRLEQQKLADKQKWSLLLCQKAEQLQICQLQTNLASQQLSSLKQKYAASLEQLERQSTKISELEEILIINNEIKVKELQEQQVRQRNSQAKAKELEQQNKVSAQNSLRLQERALILEREVAEREALIERLQNGLSKQINANQAKNTKLISLGQTLENHLEQITALQDELRSIRELLSIEENNQTKLFQKIADLELQLYEVLTAYECLQAKSKELELQQERKSAEDNNALHQMLASLNDEQKYSRNLKQQLAKHQDQIQALRSTLIVSTNESQRLLKQIEEMSSFAEKVSQEKDKIILMNAEENGSLQQQVISLNQKIMSLNQKIVSLNQKIVSLNQKIVSLNQKIVSLNQKISSKTAQAEQKESQLQEYSQNISSATNELNNYKREAQKLRAQIQLSFIQRNSLTQQGQRLKLDIKQLQRSHGTEIAQLQAQCQNYNGLIKVLNSQLQQQRENCLRVFQRNSQGAETLQAQIQQLTRQLKAKEAEIQNLKSLTPHPQMANQQQVANERIPINIISCNSQASQQQQPAINIINCQSEASEQELPLINIITCQSEASEQELPLINIITCQSEASEQELPLINIITCQSEASEQEFPLINIIACQSEASEQELPLINIITCQSEASQQEEPLNDATDKRNGAATDKNNDEKGYTEALLRALCQKDEQILELQQEIDRLASQINQAYDLMEQIQAYKQELELHEEERTAFEAAACQQNLETAQLRQQSANLKHQLGTLAEKCNQLELNLYLAQQTANLLQQEKQGQAAQLEEEKVDYQLNIEVSNLRVRVRQLEDRNGSLQAELDDKEEKHVVDLIDQHIRLSKSDQLDSHARSNSRISREALPGFLQTCRALLETLGSRKALRLPLGREVGDAGDGGDVGRVGVEHIPQYSRMVSLELQKMKSQLLKGDRRTSVSELFRNCENSIKTLCAYVQQCCCDQ